MKTRARGLMIVLVVLAMVAVACGGGGRGSSSKSNGGKSGAPGSATGFDGKTITVGAISPQTGIASIIGIPLTAGNQVYFDGLNAKGGIAGKYKVKLEVRDSAYNSNTAQQNYSDLRDNVAMLAQVLGYRHHQCAAHPHAPGRHGGSSGHARRPVGARPQPPPGRGSVPDRGDQRVGVLGQRGRWEGQDALRHPLRRPLRAGGPRRRQVRSHEARLQPRHRGGVPGLVDRPDRAAPAGAHRLRRRLARRPAHRHHPDDGDVPRPQALDVRWIGQAPTWVSLLASGATGDYLAKHFWLAAQGPQWGDTSSPGMKQMLADIAKYKPDQKPDLYFAFGYAQALTVSKLLEKAVELGDLSHAGVKKALNKLGTVDTLGLAGTYKYGPPDQRVPPEQTTIFGVDPSVPGALKALKVNYESGDREVVHVPEGLRTRGELPPPLERGCFCRQKKNNSAPPRPPRVCKKDPRDRSPAPATPISQGAGGQSGAPGSMPQSPRPTPPCQPAEGREPQKPQNPKGPRRALVAWAPRGEWAEKAPKGPPPPPPKTATTQTKQAAPAGPPRAPTGASTPGASSRGKRSTLTRSPKAPAVCGTANGAALSTMTRRSPDLPHLAGQGPDAHRAALLH